jgi:hypothetical protein
MLLRSLRNRDNRAAPGGSRWHIRIMPWVRGFVCVSALAMLSTAYEVSSQSPQQPSATPDKPLPDANRPPDASKQMAVHDQQAKDKNVDAASIERKQITDDSARLLKLASDLKAEVDKTNKDTLSLGVIRKAEEIEKLAHNVKEKMKLTMAAN